jgi:Protein of unknown function (DUF3047)
MRGSAVSSYFEHGAVALALATLGVTARAAPPLLDVAGQLHPAWQLVGLPQAKAPLTRFSAERLDGRSGVRIEADRSYGNWVHTFNPPVPLTLLRWAWRVDRINPRTDLASKSGDDVPARVCVSFEMPLERLSFIERQKLTLARALSKLNLAAATLCYVWARDEARGALIDSAFTRRVRQIVLRNASDAAGTWYEERRDLAADFLFAFGDEMRELPSAGALIVSGDSDNTGVQTLAHVADLQAQP